MQTKFHKLIGGPFGREVIPLGSPGTLTFAVRGQVGRYNGSNVWEPAKPQNDGTLPQPERK